MCPFKNEDIIKRVKYRRALEKNQQGIRKFCSFSQELGNLAKNDVKISSKSKFVNSSCLFSLSFGHM